MNPRCRRTLTALIYLDNNATTQPAPQVVEAVAAAMRERWANPSSIHRTGQDARHALELARESIAALIGAKPKNLTLTSGGTEAIDLAINGAMAAVIAARRKTGTHAEIEALRARAERRDASTPSPTDLAGPSALPVSTNVEHAAVQALLGKAANILPVNADGRIDQTSLERVIAAGTPLVSVQWANNETGAIQPIDAVYARCRQVGALFHCDATQWVGKMPVDVGDLSGATPPCDILTFSAHKWHGPKGVGVVWTRPGVRLVPRLQGTQENGRRGGTENVEGIIGAGVAAQLASQWLANPAERARLAALRDRFEQLVLEDCPGSVVNGPKGEARLWNTTNIAFPRLEAEALLMAFSERGLCASAGAACSSGSLDPSPVLLAMGIPPELAHGSVRFSLSRFTTEQEMGRAAAIVAEGVTKVRASMT